MSENNVRLMIKLFFVLVLFLTLFYLALNKDITPNSYETLAVGSIAAFSGYHAQNKKGKNDE